MKELTEDDQKEIARLDAEIAHLESEIGLRIALREVTRTGKGYPPADFDDEADEANARTRQIRALVRRQLSYYIENDLKGDELLMKEVWEECATANEKAAAERELETVLAWLSRRSQDLG